MKYIKTKDGVYEVIKIERAYYEGQPLLYSCKQKRDFVEEQDILKQADTIEELCDEFVAIVENKSSYLFSIYEIDNKKYVYINEESGEPLLETFIKNKIIYGAIWTDKGLIYVAKMNDKGELELL